MVKEFNDSLDILFNRPNDIYDFADPLAIGIDLSTCLTVENEDGYSQISIEEMITDENDWILNLPRITKEEFYNPEFGIYFGYVNSPYNGNELGFVPLQYDKGMTWREWVDSNYNILEEIGFPVSVWEEGNTIRGYYESAMAWWIRTPDGEDVHPDDMIEDKTYRMSYVG